MIYNYPSMCSGFCSSFMIEYFLYFCQFSVGLFLIFKHRVSGCHVGCVDDGD